MNILGEGGYGNLGLGVWVGPMRQFRAASRIISRQSQVNPLESTKKGRIELFGPVFVTIFQLTFSDFTHRNLAERNPEISKFELEIWPLACGVKQL